jgi:hypothetical protein
MIGKKVFQKKRKSNFEYSEIAKKVVIKQLNTEAVNKCSGDQMLGIPLSNSGVVATSIVVGNSGDEISPFLSLSHFKFTL